MFERELTLYRFMWNYLKTLAADLEEDQMGVSPFPGANPPVWILGHLAICTDSAGRILGLPRECPKEWHAMFAPGTNPADVKPPYPSKADLVAAIGHGHRRVSEAMPNASPEVLNQPHNIPLLKPTNLETLGDVLAHLMTTHEAFHVAQLSACRRKTGKGPVV